MAPVNCSYQVTVMCGIIGFTGDGKALEVLLKGLRRLEYRGYDSSGLALPTLLTTLMPSAVRSASPDES